MNERIAKLKSYLEKSPGDLFLNHALALEYIKADSDIAALELFEMNLRTDPGYIATYYHLGKLYERINEKDKAISTYETGMKQARLAGEMRTYSELQSAYEDLIY